MANAELEQKHADELGVGAYTFKKIGETLIMGGTMVAGTVGGFFTGKLFKTGELNPLATDLLTGNAAVAAENAAETVERTGFFNKMAHKARLSDVGLAVAGLGLGTLIGGLVIGYKHWRNKESQRLAVDEINKDMSNTMAIQPTDKELVIENKRLRGMLEEMDEKHEDHGHSHAASKHLTRGKKSHVEHAAHDDGEMSRA